MRNQITFTANTTQKLCDIHATRVRYLFTVTIYALGTFGGGTLSFFFSPDNGTTFIPLAPNFGATAVTATAPGMQRYDSGFPSSNFQPAQIYVTLAGATAPNITVIGDDNRN